MVRQPRSNRLSDTPLPELEAMLAATERFAGVESASAKAIRRAIERKRIELQQVAQFSEDADGK